MSKELQARVQKFALDCIRLAEKCPKTFAGEYISHQLLRAASSSAANFRAALHAQSKSSFIAKLSIVIEESDESEFWLDMTIKSEIFNNDEVNKLKIEAHELASIFIKSRITARNNEIRKMKDER